MFINPPFTHVHGQGINPGIFKYARYSYMAVIHASVYLLFVYMSFSCT